MAHLKKFSLASKLSRIASQQLGVYELVIFGMEYDDCLFYSQQQTVNFSANFRWKLKNLLHSLQNYHFAYLASNQVGLDDRCFAMNLNPTQWNDLEDSELQPLVLVNPQIAAVSKSHSVDWEVNQCFPFLRAQVNRYDHIQIHYQDQFSDDQTLELKGFPARVAQQALDCLNGYQIVDPRINLGRWELNEKWTNSLPKLQLCLTQYRSEIQKLVENHPQFFKLRDVEQLNKRVKENDEEFSFESTMMKRLQRYVRRELIGPLKEKFETDQDILNELKNVE